MPNSITPQNLWSEMLRFKHLLGLRHGFTIPFLVGAYYKWGFIKEADFLSSDCIKYLLDRVLESTNNENPIKIFDCPDLYNEPVLQYLATGLSDKDIQDIKGWKSNKDQKIYWHKGSEIEDIDTLIEWLWEKPAACGGIHYRELISSGRFSCDIKCWSPFNAKEEKFIENINILDTVDDLNNLKQN